MDSEFLARLKAGRYAHLELIVACCWIVEEEFEWSPERVLKLSEMIHAECKRLGQDAGITALELIVYSHNAMQQRAVN